MKKVLIGMEKEFYLDRTYVGRGEPPREGEKYNFIFSDGSVLSLWEGGPSSERESRGGWKWEKGRRPFSHRLRSSFMEVLIKETGGGIRINSTSGTLVASLSDEGVCINTELFERTTRAMPGRPVWIFTGASALGKSTIGMLLSLSGKEVYETDTSDSLPEVIWADVIVSGRRRGGFPLEEIKRRLPDGVKPILVNFSNLEGYPQDF